MQRLEREVRIFSLSLQGPKFKTGILAAAAMFGGMWTVNKLFGGTPVARVRAVFFLVSCPAVGSRGRAAGTDRAWWG